MKSIKHNALASIKDMLDEKMAGHFKPKAIEVKAVGEKPMEEGSPEEEMGEPMTGEKMHELMTEEKSEGEGMLPPEADKLDPEEKSQLESLYAKMGL